MTCHFHCLFRLFEEAITKIILNELRAIIKDFKVGGWISHLNTLRKPFSYKQKVASFVKIPINYWGAVGPKQTCSTAHPKLLDSVSGSGQYLYWVFLSGKFLVQLAQSLEIRSISSPCPGEHVKLSVLSLISLWSCWSRRPVSCRVWSEGIESSSVENVDRDSPQTHYIIYFLDAHYSLFTLYKNIAKKST